ncbi:MAG: hypothetical protein RLZZ33_1143 [Pseudomonadota bacterium]
MLMQGDNGRLEIEFSVIMVVDPSLGPLTRAHHPRIALNYGVSSPILQSRFCLPVCNLPENSNHEKPSR